MQSIVSLPLIWEPSFLNEITSLITFKSCDPNFELMLHFKRNYSADCYDSDLWNSGYFQKFILSVNKSSFSIQLLKVGSDFITNLMSELDADVYKKFIGRIIWINLDFRCVSRLNSPSDCNMISKCNWVCYKKLSRGLQEAENTCSLDIQRLEIGINNTIFIRLPGSLTFINLHIENFGPRRLHDLLVLVSKQCPSLNTLSLSMKYRHCVYSHSVSWSNAKFLCKKSFNNF